MLQLFIGLLFLYTVSCVETIGFRFGECILQNVGKAPADLTDEDFTPCTSRTSPRYWRTWSATDVDQISRKGTDRVTLLGIQGAKENPLVELTWQSASQLCLTYVSEEFPCCDLSCQKTTSESEYCVSPDEFCAIASSSDGKPIRVMTKRNCELSSRDEDPDQYWVFLEPTVCGSASGLTLSVLLFSLSVFVSFL